MAAKPHLYKAEGIASLERNPPELVEAGKRGGRIRCSTSVWVIPASGSGSLVSGDVFHACRVPSHATPCSIRIKHEHMATAINTRLDIGLYSAEETPVEQDMNCFCSDYSVGVVSGTGSNTGHTEAEMLLECQKEGGYNNQTFSEPFWKYDMTNNWTKDPQMDYYVTVRAKAVNNPVTTEIKLVITVLYIID